ncbi:MAG: hypothetical protein QM602_05940, partial [Microbacterium sp.]
IPPKVASRPRWHPAQSIHPWPSPSSMRRWMHGVAAGCMDSAGVRGLGGRAAGGRGLGEREERLEGMTGIEPA